MKEKSIIIIVVVLIVAIIAVVFMQEQRKNRESQARQQQAASEAAIALQYLNYANNQAQIDAQESAGVGDWLNTIGSIGNAVSSIFTGMSVGGGGGGASGGGADSGNGGGFLSGLFNKDK